MRLSDPFRAQIPEIDIHDIRECLAYNHPLGNDRFREQVEPRWASVSGGASAGVWPSMSMHQDNSLRPF